MGRPRSTYRNQLAEYAESIEAAEKNNDQTTVEVLRREREQLKDHMNAATNITGRSRTFGPAARSKSARSSVRQALERAYDRLRKGGSVEIANHLDHAIRTEGCAYAYRPSTELDWQLA